MYIQLPAIPFHGFLVFSGKCHKSGSLYNILGNFIFNNVNMTMIESRPIPEKSFEYRFFVDFEGNLSDAGVRNALTGLAAEASVMRILGNY